MQGGLAVACGQFAELRDGVLGAIGAVGVRVVQAIVDKPGDALAVDAIERRMRRRFGIGVGTDEGGAVVADLDVPPARPRGDALRCRGRVEGRSSRRLR